MNILRDWNDFWFRPVPSGPLGLFRVVFGSVLVAWGLLLAPPDLYTWFSDQGLMPKIVDQTYGLGSGTFNPLAHFHDPRALLAFYLVYLIAALCFTIGLSTRLATIATFLGLLAFHDRDPIMLNGGDTLERLLVFYMIFAPAGAACSVDRLIGIARGSVPAGEPPRIEPWPQRLIQLQISAVYLSTVMSKSEGVMWQDGTALYYPLHLTQFYRFPLGPLPDLMWAINIGTYMALATEFSMATFVWVPRLRGYVLAAGAMLHLGIDYAMNIPLFSFLMISSYINFVPNSWLTDWTSRISRALTRYRLEVIYHAEPATACRAVAVLTRMDAAHLLTFVPAAEAQAGPAGLCVSGRGWSSSGTEAMRRILACCPALWPLVPVLLIPGASRLLLPITKPFAPSSAEPQARQETLSKEPLVSSEHS